MDKIYVSPSILSADFSRLGKEVSRVVSCGADTIHFDVMDNHYVPNLTVGPGVLKSLRRYGISIQIDVHLMIRPVCDRLILDFINSGANCIIFHPEVSDNIVKSLRLIRKYGCKAGLAISPNVSLDFINDFINEIDIILILSVNPGFSNQTFLLSSVKKIKQAKILIEKSGLDIDLSVDGGINIKNVSDVACLGVNILVIGSAIFDRSDYLRVMKEIRNKLKNFL
ncbi:Ribulose-phosphate 3-epimerase [Candidatus Westeberhardia cardiocondylae]|uniref:Ribulose-phosphate 3-epimerase n=1 Tax=Candidatus Westeberhardia cardiocondylae TaxID=1594731 RepID=A0A0H5C4X7_9ENTR|nr:ribulose-phosphate 3-epimerase [Candidatus Westeberhardia cardiocondylae]MCR3756149.1 ribulose-phosphate 3-epimerase [Candidatus Westeberhardia cardiocondylae]CEN32026.1 Ribulose-phosphate 3-epimerase [Candidatus Westeberhardia cardiocondylae]